MQSFFAVLYYKTQIFNSCSLYFIVCIIALTVFSRMPLITLMDHDDNYFKSDDIFFPVKCSRSIRQRVYTHYTFMKNAFFFFFQDRRLNINLPHYLQCGFCTNFYLIIFLLNIKFYVGTDY